VINASVKTLEVDKALSAAVAVVQARSVRNPFG
jgi:hypothetical protein